MSIKIIQETSQSSFWQRLNRVLLPEDQEVGNTRYIWLCYLAIYFVSFFFAPVSKTQLMVTIIGMAAFLLLYFRAFWVSDRRLIMYLFGIWLLGFSLGLHGMSGASVFFVFTGAFCAQFKSPKTAFAVLLVAVAATLILGMLVKMPLYIYLPGAFFCLLIGSSNVYLAQMAKKNRQIKASQEEIKKMAASAERERIARDLHDLIGHTFSAINVKSQLAAKLAESDPLRARNEINEIEHISRTSLAQVREAVSGYRQRDLATELAHARVLLGSLDIHVIENITAVDTLGLSQHQDIALAYIVRELSTNIMRHAEASQCHIRLQRQGQQVMLCFEDDGQANAGIIEGAGLQGIRERIQAIGGQLTYETSQGFKATITLNNT